jgi:hypothetical protein
MEGLLTRLGGPLYDGVGPEKDCWPLKLALEPCRGRWKDIMSWSTVSGLICVGVMPSSKGAPRDRPVCEKDRSLQTWRG